MNRYKSVVRVGIVSCLTICFAEGCGKAPSNDGATSAVTAPASAKQNPATDAATRAAANFLDAVIKGDTQRASACLTPQAMQRIIASGKPFAPQGMENATFRVGEVRTPAVDRAFVHCIVTDNSTEKPQSDEMCCLMRLVENEWRVSGIAYWGPNQNGTMSDFETGQSMPIPRQPASPNMAGQPAAPPAAPTSIPPQVANGPESNGTY